MNYIESLSIVLGYRCNLKCRHCDIWSNRSLDHLDAAILKSILDSAVLRESARHLGEHFDISIAGGEPFLYDDLTEIIEEIELRFPGSLHTISTNGTMEDQILQFLEKRYNRNSPPIKLNVSLDGPKEVHELQRGTPGSFRKTMRTILRIKQQFPHHPVELKYTITKDNFRSLKSFTKLANELRVHFSFKPAENIPSYTNQSSSPHASFTTEEIDEIERQIIGNPYIAEQSYYISPNFFEAIPSYLRHGLSNRHRCEVAKNSLTIMPDRTVYGCMLMQAVGSTLEQSIDEIWHSPAIEQQRNDICNGKCVGCMLMCGSFKSPMLFVP